MLSFALKGAFVLLLYFTNALAATPTATPKPGPTPFSDPASVMPMYENASLTPNRILPFRVYGLTPSAKVEIISMSVSNTGLADCRIMLDPFQTTIILLKCTRETDVRFDLLVATGDSKFRLLYGPLGVRKPVAESEIIEPEAPIADPEIRAGKALFSSICLACHNPATTKAGRTVSKIKAAIARPDNIPVGFVNKMKGLKIPDDDLKKIEKYLGSL